MLPLSSGMTVATIPKSVGNHKDMHGDEVFVAAGGSLTTRGVFFELLLVRYTGR
jgi:hypothetical protein